VFAVDQTLKSSGDNTGSLMRQVGSQLVQPLFISIDPVRDTPQQLKARSSLSPVSIFQNVPAFIFEQEYLKDWHPRLIGLTGTPEQVQSFARFLLFFHGNRAIYLFAPPMLCEKHDVASQVAQVARTFRVFFSKAKTGDGPEDYLVDHRSLLFFPWHSVLTFSLTYL
jgi:cytochrome oxidase Cu insertion factor (SCO1/SenC/PrrC family)